MRRFDSDYERLLKLADDDAERIKVNRDTGTVWSLSEDRLTYELLAGIDAFIFEARSTYEILGKFLVTFCRIIFAQALTEETLKGILREEGLDVAWATLLHDERILFFHQTAPWLALMFDDARSASPELLIVRGNVQTLDEGEFYAFIRLQSHLFGVGECAGQTTEVPRGKNPRFREGDCCSRITMVCFA